MIYIYGHGKCAENCMVNNITIKYGRPVWGKDCTHCMACICKCPTSAIEYGKNIRFPNLRSTRELYLKMLREL